MKSHIFSISGLISLFIFICLGCQQKTDETLKHTMIDSVVFADVETYPVDALSEMDAADDPAIWIHPSDPSKSLILGTNKKGGISVYNLHGEEIHYYRVGNANNVDVRYGFQFGNGTKGDIIACSERIDDKIMVFRINQEDGSLTEISGSRLTSSVNEAYGFCLYKKPDSYLFYAFVNDTTGIIEQWELVPYGDEEISGQIIRTMSVASQTEGMVADDELGYLYVGEEDRGIWKFMVDPDASHIPVFISESDTSNVSISFDIEGLAIYYASEQKGYLIASSQGNSSFAIFERLGDNKYIGSFVIKGERIDGTEETDGIDVTNLNLGGLFSKGLFVAQDDSNLSGDSILSQNFKLVRWEKIASLFDPPLIIDSIYNDHLK
jgi:3-phytase